MTEISFMPVPILGLIACCVPVVPGTTDAEAPLEDRTELCAVDANWVIGQAPTCDIHARLVCEMMEIDWPELVAEAGRDLGNANRLASERERHTQDEARDCKRRFMSGEVA